MTSPITDFIEARLAEDEERALQASPGPWHLNAEHDEVIAVDDIEVCRAFALSSNQQRNTARFIAEHDPARVLREVAAKRALLEHHGDQHECTNWEFASAYPYVGCSVLRELAAVYSDHPEFNPEWTVTS